MVYMCITFLLFRVNQEQAVSKLAFLTPVQFTLQAANLPQSIEALGDKIELVLRLVGMQLCPGLWDR